VVSLAVKPFSIEVKERLPRIALDFVGMIITLVVAYVVIPIASAINFSVPVIGLSIGLALAVIFLVILTILAVRILRDATMLAHHGSHMLAEVVPDLEESQRNLIRRVARDFISAVVIVVLFYVLTPFIVMIPGVGASLAAAIPLVLTAVVVILLYDAGRLLYDEASKSIHKVTDKLASIVEESEKSK
jgi:hypothetical protein